MIYFGYTIWKTAHIPLHYYLQGEISVHYQSKNWSILKKKKIQIEISQFCMSFVLFVNHISFYFPKLFNNDLLGHIKFRSIIK